MESHVAKKFAELRGLDNKGKNTLTRVFQVYAALAAVALPVVLLFSALKPNNDQTPKQDRQNIILPDSEGKKSSEAPFVDPFG